MDNDQNSSSMGANIRFNVAAEECGHAKHGETRREVGLNRYLGRSSCSSNLYCTPVEEYHN